MPYPAKSIPHQIQLLTPEEIKDPLEVIVYFYESEHLYTASKCLHKWLRAAFANKNCLNKIETLNILYFQEQLTRLLEAAWLLEQGKHKNKSVILNPDSTPNLLNPILYCSKKFRQYDEWQSLPRHLTRAEFLNPYKAFDKCFRLMPINEWRVLLKKLFQAAAYTDSIYGTVSDKEDDLYMYKHCLFKLLEACHLIAVRLF